MLVDSHCHLNYPEFTDIHEVVKEAEEAGVRTIQTISTKRSDFDEVIAIAEAHPNIYCSIGIHPHEAENHADLTLEELLERSGHPKVIGIGETGLDFYYEHSPRDIQEKLFRIHIEASRQTGLPLIVHSRDADEDTVRILHEEYEKGTFPGLIHCFSTTKYLSDKAIEIGFSISIAGIVTFKKSQALRDIVQEIPMDRLLVETDAPYLAPEPHRGKPNHPAYTSHTAKRVSDIKGIEYQEVCDITSSNFFNLFSKAKRPV